MPRPTALLCLLLIATTLLGLWQPLRAHRHAHVQGSEAVRAGGCHDHAQAAAANDCGQGDCDCGCVLPLALAVAPTDLPNLAQARPDFGLRHPPAPGPVPGAHWRPPTA